MPAFRKVAPMIRTFTKQLFAALALTMSGAAVAWAQVPTDWPAVAGDPGGMK